MRPGPEGTLKDTGPMLELSPAAGHDGVCCLFFCYFANETVVSIGSTQLRVGSTGINRPVCLIELGFVLRENMYVLALSQQGKQATKQMGLHRQIGIPRQAASESSFDLTTKTTARLWESLRTVPRRNCVCPGKTREKVFIEC